MGNFFQLLTFACRRQWKLLLAVAVFVAVALIVIQPFTNHSHVSEWETVDALLGVVTLSIALLVWVWGVRSDWENSLPKRLDVIYLHDGQPVIACENASLIAEGDIRGMAQQMGAQIVSERFLKLSPIMEVKRPKVDRSGEDGHSVKRYAISIHLEELPKLVADARTGEGGRPNAVKVRKVINGDVVDEIVDGYESNWS